MAGGNEAQRSDRMELPTPLDDEGERHVFLAGRSGHCAAMLLNSYFLFFCGVIFSWFVFCYNPLVVFCVVQRSVTLSDFTLTSHQRRKNDETNCFGDYFLVPFYCFCSSRCAIAGDYRFSHGSSTEIGKSYLGLG
ncbi:MAG: hypothetical protein LBC02_04275 [Planctomycetaceae bacterium]|nr:hypothetical protein [Planctomycetaceae bacterium]